jgi:hypothetical protein
VFSYIQVLEAVPAYYTPLFHCICTDVAVDSDERWQRAYDEVIDDWHASRELKGELTFGIFFVGHTPLSLLPAHLQPELKHVVHGSYSPLSTISIVCNVTPFRELLDTTDKDSKSSLNCKVTSKLSVKPDFLSVTQLDRLKKLGAIKSGQYTIPDIDPSWKWSRVRQEVCNHMSTCMMLVYTPFDVLGHSRRGKVAQEKRRADAIKAAHGQATEPTSAADRAKKQAALCWQVTIICIICICVYTHTHIYAHFVGR